MYAARHREWESERAAAQFEFRRGDEDSGQKESIRGREGSAQKAVKAPPSPAPSKWSFRQKSRAGVDTDKSGRIQDLQDDDQAGKTKDERKKKHAAELEGLVRKSRIDSESILRRGVDARASRYWCPNSAPRHTSDVRFRREGGRGVGAISYMAESEGYWCAACGRIFAIVMAHCIWACARVFVRQTADGVGRRYYSPSDQSRKRSGRKGGIVEGKVGEIGNICRGAEGVRAPPFLHLPRLRLGAPQINRRS
ncbi:hypothetical protein FB451DRAFT_1367034 [Mycena latifolia]|nr:hypothetical protein FB451DRAFT_1367034 [Mycena latifolia]